VLGWEKDFLAQYLQFTQNSAGFKAVTDWLSSRYKGSIENLDKSWNIAAKSFQDLPQFLNAPGLNKSAYNADVDDWLFEVATQYFKLTHDVRTVLKNVHNHVV
jgi:hypothetical protein